MDEQTLENVPRCTWAEFKKNITDKKPFEAISPMGTALIRIKSYEPIIGLAIHAGHRVREEAASKMAIEEGERLYEEDCGVEQFIADLPIQMIGLDSRYEYDVNRKPDQCVYLKPFQSWGKRVWNHPPTKEEIDVSLQKWDEFHEMLMHLMEEITTAFGKTLVLDVHSYNYKRPNLAGKVSTLPVFNLATSAHDQKTHRKALDILVSELSKISFSGGTLSTVKENDVFKKDGAVAITLEPKFPESLIVPVEVKKIYMDELTGELNGKLVEILRTSFPKIAQKTATQLRGQ